MATYYGTASGVGTGVQSLANPATNGKVKALQCKYTGPSGTLAGASDKIFFGRIPVGSIILSLVGKWDDCGTGTTLTLQDGDGGTSLTGAIAIGTAGTGAFDYAGIGVAITSGEIYGDIGTADWTAGAVFNGYLLYASPQ